MNKTESGIAFHAYRKIEVAIFVMRNVYPNLYREAGIYYMRDVMRRVLQNHMDPESPGSNAHS